MNFRRATIEDLDMLVATRIEVLRAANRLDELYKRMGFEEVGEKDGIVSMRMSLLRTE